MTVQATTDFIVKILEEMIDKYKLAVWIVDEFDVISDGSKRESDIEDLLTWFREVYDKILKSDTIKSQKGFFVIMAHTMDSSKEFKKQLDKLHAPLSSRAWNMIDIGYRFDETINNEPTQN